MNNSEDNNATWRPLNLEIHKSEEYKAAWQQWSQSITSAAIHATEKPYQATVTIRKLNCFGRLVPRWLRKYLPYWLILKDPVELKVSRWEEAAMDDSGHLAIILSFEDIEP
jgi:hypothetical protein